MRAGIDLGTTYSEIAAVNEFNNIELLQEHNTYGIPSVFYCNNNGEIFIGDDAVAGGTSDIKNMVLDVKMRLNENFDLPNGNFTSENIVSYIYKEVIEQGILNAEAKGFDNKNIDGIVLTCPNKFNEKERELLLHAAAFCNGPNALPVLAIIKEPVAAAIFYTKFNENNPNEAIQVQDKDAILVYDLGGGTCDIALVQYTPNDEVLFQVIDSDMLRIGGRDWDAKIAGHLEGQLHIQPTPEIRNSLRKEAENLKKRLSKTKNNNVAANFHYLFNGLPQIAQLQLTLDNFIEVTQDLLEQTMELLTEMYNKHQKDYNIKSVVCVGGGSKIRLIRETISDRIPDCPCRLAYDPEYAVVKGAALYAHMLNNAVPILDMVPQELEQQDINPPVLDMAPQEAEQQNINPPVPGPAILKDIVSFSYGFKVNLGYDKIKNLIIRNKELPVSKRLPCHAQKNAENVDFCIYRNDSDNEECDLNDPSAEQIGTLRVDISDFKELDTINIETIMTLDENQLLRLTVLLPDGTKRDIALECNN